MYFNVIKNKKTYRAIIDDIIFNGSIALIKLNNSIIVYPVHTMDGCNNSGISFSKKSIEILKSETLNFINKKQYS